MKKIIFAHGMEGSPKGAKGTYMRERLGVAAPWLGELDLQGQVEALFAVLPPDDQAVVVGSSLGGLAAFGLANRCPERLRHLVLLAPAVGMERHKGEHPEIEAARPGLFDQAASFSTLAVPGTVPCTIIHGMEDEAIRLEDVVALARRSPSATLILVHDDHALIKTKGLILETLLRAADDSTPA